MNGKNYPKGRTMSKKIPVNNKNTKPSFGISTECVFLYVNTWSLMPTQKPQHIKIIEFDSFFLNGATGFFCSFVRFSLDKSDTCDPVHEKGL